MQVKCVGLGLGLREDLSEEEGAALLDGEGVEEGKGARVGEVSEEVEGRALALLLVHEVLTLGARDTEAATVGDCRAEPVLPAEAVANGEGVGEMVLPEMVIPYAPVKIPRMPPAPHPAFRSVHDKVLVPTLKPLLTENGNKRPQGIPDGPSDAL